jgi:alcohol dehydrogenase (cytochrome c)
MTMRTLASVAVLFASMAPICLGADVGLNPQDQMKPLSTDWPTFNGDYSGKRYSSLSQINQENVSKLTLAWVLQPQSVGIKSTPLEVNGILYFTTPDNVWAADARTGRIIWHYYRESTGDHIGNRGVGMYKDWLYFETPDCHLISLNAKDGSVRWNIQLADPKLEYFATMAA